VITKEKIHTRANDKTNEFFNHFDEDTIFSRVMSLSSYKYCFSKKLTSSKESCVYNNKQNMNVQFVLCPRVVLAGRRR
jgi:hypothetical protein